VVVGGGHLGKGVPQSSPMKKTTIRELREAASHSGMSFRSVKRMYHQTPAGDRAALLQWLRTFNSSKTMTIATRTRHDTLRTTQREDAGC